MLVDEGPEMSDTDELLVNARDGEESDDTDDDDDFAGLSQGSISMTRHRYTFDLQSRKKLS